MRARGLALALTLVLPASLATTGCKGKSSSQSRLRHERATHVVSSGDDDSTLKAKVGETVEVNLGSPRGVAPEYRFQWGPEPALEGAAVKFIERRVEGPGSDIDGGSFTHRFLFEAVAAGESQITLTPSPPDQGGGESAPTEPWTITVAVEG